MIKMEGTVVEVLRNAMFRIQFPEIANPVIGTINGKMRMHNIQVLLGDQVEVEFSPYDMNRARIVKRK